jgi:hypothetical protein
MEPRSQLVACVIRQYGAGLYRAWVSLDKGHTVCLGAYQDEANATETIDHFWEIYQDGRIKTPEDILTHIDPGRAQDMTAPSHVIGQTVGKVAV